MDSESSDAPTPEPSPVSPLPHSSVWGWTQRIVSLAAVVALTPVFALLWVLVKGTSRGPFLHRVQREGFLGEPFSLYKVRTTRQPEPYAVVRQTPIGTALRVLKLDELPQLWNVVKGDLLWVGPRPLPVSVASRLASKIENFRERQRVKPGLTNLGSVSTIYDESSTSGHPDFRLLVKADLHYLENRSVGYDLISIGLSSLYIVRRALASVFRSRSGGRGRNATFDDPVTRDLQTWLISYERKLQPRQSSLLWAFAQRCLGLLGLVAAAPIFAFMYIGVKITSPGPFLFCQSRRGFLGRPFKIYKVRSLSVGSEKKTALGVQNSDPTVTRFGSMMRTLKLDELPQLFNVLRGDMELVGPRPIPMALEDKLLEHIPDFGMRHLVRPGLTNVGQVSVMDNELDDRLIADWTIRAEAERHYVAHKSLAYDIVMVVLTSLYILRKFINRGPKAAEPKYTATRILGTPVANLGYDGVIELFDEWIEGGEPVQTVNICPVHSIVEGVFNKDHRSSLDQADLNTADGMPIVWAKRILGDKESSRVYGPTLMINTLEVAEKKGWRIGLFGGHPDRLDLLHSNLLERFPDLNVAFKESPPFRPLDDAEESSLINRMNAARLDICWVGLGCPKQERWMREHRNSIRGIFVGVGAAFDFHAGKLRQAPGWMQVAGLEWFFRLLCEPRRLFGRYAKTNPAFMGLFGLQVLRRVFLRKSFREPLEFRSEETGGQVTAPEEARKAA